MFIKIKNLTKRHFQNNYIVYFTQIMFLIISIIMGAVFVNKLSEDECMRIASYLHWIFKYDISNYSSMDIFKLSLFDGFKIFLLIWSIGFVGLGIIVIPLVIVWKGFSIGFITGFIVKQFNLKGFIFSIIGLLPYYLIFLFGFLALCSIGLSYSIYNAKNKKHRVSLNEILDYSTLIFLFFLIMVIGFFIEGFLTFYFLRLIQIIL